MINLLKNRIVGPGLPMTACNAGTIQKWAATVLHPLFGKTLKNTGEEKCLEWEELWVVHGHTFCLEGEMRSCEDVH